MPRNGDRDWRSPGFSQNDRHPVVCVNWSDAKAYVAWLASSTRERYRLLTETEREYVTRAGSITPFWWGTTISTDQANYDGSIRYADGAPGVRRKATLPVDSFCPILGASIMSWQCLGLDRGLLEFNKHGKPG